MKDFYTERYNKQLASIKDPDLLADLRELTKSIIKAKKPQDIPGIKILKHVRNTYRVRIGDYRIGLIIFGQDVYFIVMDHRRRFYNKFP